VRRTRHSPRRVNCGQADSEGRKSPRRHELRMSNGETSRKRRAEGRKRKGRDRTLGLMMNWRFVAMDRRAAAVRSYEEPIWMEPTELPETTEGPSLLRSVPISAIEYRDYSSSIRKAGSAFRATAGRLRLDDESRRGDTNCWEPNDSAAAEMSENVAVVGCVAARRLDGARHRRTRLRGRAGRTPRVH